MHNKVARARAPLGLFCFAGGDRQRVASGRCGRLRQASPDGGSVKVEAVSVTEASALQSQLIAVSLPNGVIK
jgi:hypothetical protein